ncbi:MAG: riboflavin synthase [Flavobacteriales bacterium]|jgi:riboflavin synthase|nr:riboflavin synthase [Flavobacteriales bacterium]
MFTGIIEQLGKVVDLKKDQTNVHLTIEANFTDELQIDQSVAHNGVCLTVVEKSGKNYVVTAIDETLQKSNIGLLSTGDLVNLERCTQIGNRLDGHIVQGHVDQTAKCIAIKNADGSWIFTFEYEDQGNITVEKGSVTINGVSLTVVNSNDNQFSVAIIPYTYEHTNFHTFKIGTTVNLEFDIVGKYVTKLIQKQLQNHL